MFLILNAILMIVVFVLVLCFSLEAMKFASFPRRTQVVISLCVALLCAISLCSPVPVATKDGMINVILIPYQGLAILVLLVALLGLIYKLIGEKKRREINQRVKKLFDSFGK